MPSEIEQLYREHRGRLVRLVERELRDHHDAEDVVQTAFLDAQRALEHGTIPRDPRAWLAAIALNAARRLRRRRPKAEPLEEYAVQEASGMSEIREALANLTREQQAAVLYRDVLGFSYGETAEQMGTSVNAVTMLLHRGRRRLRQTLGVAVGGVGLWRWLRQGGTPQIAAVKGAAAVVAAAGLATGGIVAAGHTVRAVAPTRSDTTAALPAHYGSPAAEAGGTAGGALARESARRPLKTGVGSSVVSPGPTSMQASTGSATPAFVRSSTTDAVTTAMSLSTLPAPTVSLPALPVAGLPATVTVSTPVAAVTVTTPTVTTATVTTPLVTVTVPIP